MLARLSALALAGALMLPSTGVAQARIGAIGGLNFATFGGDDVEGAETRTGIMAGVSLVKPLSGALSLELNGLYSMRGAKGDEDGTSLALKLNYLEVPVLLRYAVGGSATVKPHIAAGVSLGYQTGCKIEGSEGGASAEFSCSIVEEEFDAEFKKFDAQLVFGGGLDFAAGKNTFTLGARYNYGLSDIAADASTRNRGFSIFAGYSVPIGK